MPPSWLFFRSKPRCPSNKYWWHISFSAVLNKSSLYSWQAWQSVCRRMDILLYSREDIPLKLIMVASRVQKCEVFKKGSSKLFLLCELHHEKTFFFIMEERNGVFFLIFTMRFPLLRWAIWMDIQLWILLEHFYIFKH